jgi:hypothetical protein
LARDFNILHLAIFLLIFNVQAQNQCINSGGSCLDTRTFDCGGRIDNSLRCPGPGPVLCVIRNFYKKKYLILSKKDAALPMPAPRNAQAMVAIAPLNIMGAVKAHLIIIKIAQGVD